MSRLHLKLILNQLAAQVGSRLFGFLQGRQMSAVVEQRQAEASMPSAGGSMDRPL